ncbi:MULTISPECIES: helix-turn-helix domain-containing protein [unclassified Streptomyces]|uniref:helix-turn-helix domain-containing protein n=1 Tax=unclassified Streptomyces TaxID=2593676 RepID=UPI0036DC4891
MSANRPAIISRTRPCEERRRELAAFLRSRRERITPREAGLPSKGRRRTPGLRREELALLAGMSATWYTYLEQGRDIRPSDQILDALAGALRLDAHELDHLLKLAGRSLAAEEPGPEPLDPRSDILRNFSGPSPCGLALSEQTGHLMLIPPSTHRHDVPSSPRHSTESNARLVKVVWWPAASGLLKS